MLANLLGFELRQQLKSPVLWVVMFVFALLAFGASSSDTVQVGGAIGNVNRNAPYVIVSLLGNFTVLAMLLVTIFVAGAALRDFDNRTAELFFSTPVKKRDYLLARFGGGLFASIAVMLAVALGIFIGTLMPWLDSARLGPPSAAPYAWALGVLVLPNLVFIAALLFCLAVATRSMLATYIGVIAFFALSIVTGVLTADLDTRWIGAMLDPFGIDAVGTATRYWSTTERNTALPPLDGLMLANRLVWLGVAVVLLALSYSLFRTDREGLRLRRKRRAVAATTTDERAPTAAVAARAPVRLRTDFAAQWRQYLHQARFDTRGVLLGVPFLVMLLIGLFILVVNLVFGDQMFGTALYPTTHRMTQAIGGSFTLFLLIIVTFYAGELVFRERSQRIAEVTDAFPNADWIPLAAKMTALTAVVLAFYAVGVAVCIVNQLVRGYTAIEPGLYLTQILLDCLPFVLMGVLAVFLQVVSNNKFIGYLLMLVYLVSRTTLTLLNFEDNLYRPFGTSGLPYSDMNGYGHFIVGHLWMRAYWAMFAGLLIVGALLLWVRGNRSTWRERLREARRRFGAGHAVATVVFAVGFAGLGAFVFWNTHVRNEYVPGDVALDRQAEYEKLYRQYKDLPQPRIVGMRTEVDIRPEDLELDIRGTYRIVNRGDAPIDELHVDINPDWNVRSLEFGAHEVVQRDELHGYTIYRLAEPMAPGEEREFRFDMGYAVDGFGNDMGQTMLVGNGTFFNSGVLPSFGYNEGRQIVDRNERRKRDLGDVPRMPSIDDEAARANTYISDDADWLDFETIVSTAPDQIALAPGYLQREWTENGRRYFHYRMDVPMLPFAAWLSARWEVARDTWKGIPIEVYHHAPHDWNVERMIEATKDSLDYYTGHFTPYQHRQVRILEFPGYSTFAQAFANTIPYSESIGFVADLRDRDDIDYVYYVTAHEIAHQWWAHQVIGANVQGSTLLSESLSQYSALMVMEQEYGAGQMRRFLKYELDQYLASRAGELVEELPLALVENQQYIHYRKGSLVLYALRDFIGEDTLNAVLKRFLQDKGFQQPPYTTSRELLAYLREGTDPQYHPLIEDLFEKIVFFDNRAVAATATQREDGRYVVTLDVHAAKFEADGQGKETEVEMDVPVDIAVFASPGDDGAERLLHIDKRVLPAGKSSIEIVVDERPFEAGIDPYNKLIDRVSNDNRRTVVL